MRSTPILRGALGLSLAFALVAPRTGAGAPTSLSDDGRAGVVLAAQGVSLVRPVGHERWTPLEPRALLFPGDLVRTELRGANALETRLANGARLVTGPGAQVELVGEKGVRLLAGDIEVRAEAKAPLHVDGLGGYAKDVAGTLWLRTRDGTTTELSAAPRWLEGYRGSTSEEWMGSLLASVDGKNVPLTIGYHKVVVEIRDQIARTTIEESFVNSTGATLEGSFSFPLPAEASISGFGMWIGDELVEADLVEKQRARAIYEDILRRKKDPGLLEWEGGNLFKARVFPIFPHSEKRIRLRYTEVLPLEGSAYRYRYALRSELLRAHPLRELSIAVNVVSTATLTDVSSASHAVTLRKTDHEAIAEFSAQQHTPERDFELSIGVARGAGLTSVAHVRGDDGFFMLLLAPPDESAGGWTRDLVPDGAPLDLLIVADTSGSMDARARETQSAFVAALLGQLSTKDRFRLLASDVASHDLVGSPTPADEASVAAALSALEARVSLGWTDLDAAFDAALAKAGPTTHVVYVGDGIQTAGDADAVAFVERLTTKTRETKARFHAVSTSSAYERSVLIGIASIGGGSVRRADDGAAAAAKALVAEIARPALRDAKVTIEGVETAKVYPATLPNLPLGHQQIVLGRYLPRATAARATVAVTGTIDGKPVRYTSELDLVPPPKRADDASADDVSFLPRLWARRHLDALLAEGSSPAIQEEIVAFSREYQIMTPYTSFLVLENDEDRALYGVERTVRMRDAERFFAQARDKASLEIARGQMATAKRWRKNLRRQILQEIATLGRDLPIPAAVAWVEGVHGPQTEITLRFGEDASERLEAAFEGPWGAAPDRNSLLAAENTDLRQPMAAAAAPMEDPGSPDAYDGPNDGSDGDESSSDMDLDEVTNGLGDTARRDSGISYKLDAGKSLRRRAGPSGSVTRLLERTRIAAPMHPWTLAALGFPGIATPRTQPADATDPTWDPVVVKALRALDRRAALAAMAGALRLSVEQTGLHALHGHPEWARRTKGIVASGRWHVTSEGFGGPSARTWLSATERGAVDEATRLGRRRSAIDADRTDAIPFPLRDESWTRDLVRRYARTYRRPPSATQDGDVVTITFAADDDARTRHVLRIDVARGVLLEERDERDGTTTGRRTFADLVEVAGRWWARQIERTDAEGRVVERDRLLVEAIDVPTFDAELATAIGSLADVTFLEGEDPSVKASRQAIHDGTARLAHLLVAALDDGAHGRIDDVWAQWARIEAAIGAKPGVAWIRLALLANGRRGEELRVRATSLAAEIAAAKGDLARPRALALDVRTTSLGARERLGIVETLRAVWSSGGGDAELASVYGRRHEAQAALAAGMADRARAIYAGLADERPFDAADLLAYAQGVRADENLIGAVELLTARTAKGGPFLADETDALFRTRAQWLFELRDLPALARTAEEWIAANPRTAEAYQIHVSCLYLLGRPADADRWVLARLAPPPTSDVDPVARAARNAAVEIALGNGWGLGTRRIHAPWRAPLRDLALALARSDRADASPFERIVSDWRFAQTDEARTLAVALRADLLADRAIAEMPVRRLVRVVPRARRDATDAEWTAIVDALLARWRGASMGPDADLLADRILDALPNGGRNEERIAFLRERLLAAPADAAGRRADALLSALLESPYETGREAETFALLPRAVSVVDLEPADALAVGKRTHAANARRLAAWVAQGRFLAALGEPTARSTWTRAETVRKTKEARSRSQSETAARLLEAAAASEPPLRTWLDVEQQGYAVETLADLARSETAARALLEAIPTVTPVADIDALLGDRAAAILTFAATRRAAPAGLADRVVAFYRARAQADDPVIDAKEHLIRALVALDRVEDLETTLIGWTTADDVDPRWRVALAFVQAETNRPTDAAKTLEAAAAIGDLPAEAWSLLADAYLLAKEDARREDALDRRLATIDEWRLSQQLWQETSRVSRTGPGVPAELDPEILRSLRALLRKSSSPASYVQQVVALYRPTKDFRVLECLVDGVPGHSAEAVYAYVQQALGVVAEVHEEATCDAIAARIAATLPDRRWNDVDRRGLRLLLVAVEARALAVPKADLAHAERARTALRAALEGGWAAGERVLVARALASYELERTPALLVDQERALEALLAAADGPDERLRIGRQLAEVAWRSGRRDAATDRLSALLGACEGCSHVEDEHQRLIGWWSEMGRFRQAIERLRADIRTETRSERRESRRMRLFALYAVAVEKGGGADLFRAAAAEMERHLTGGAAYLLAQVAAHHGALHEAASRARIGDVGSLYTTFVNERLPLALARDPLTTIQAHQAVLPHLAAVAGPLAALTVAVGLIEQVPEWLDRVGLDTWSSLGGQMAVWRRDAGSLGALESRLLAIVLARLESALRSTSWDGSGFWYENQNKFWAAHKRDFAAVAARSAELEAKNPTTALHIAGYQRSGLDLHADAVATLRMVLASGHDPENVRSTLARWLREDGLLAEALPLYERLVVDRPDALEHRLALTGVLHGLGRAGDALRVLTETTARWKERKGWSADVAAQVATTAIGAGHMKAGAEWMDDALRMRREAGGLGREDATLSRWYQELARARSALGETDAAVRAASAAIVAWGRGVAQRRNALDRLRAVLDEAKDLGAWRARRDAEVAATGTDAPILRKVLGALDLERGRVDAAIVELRAARDLDPADVETHALLVRALDVKGDAPSALDALLRSVRTAPKNLLAYGDLASRYFKVGDLDGAERARTSLVEAMPSDPDGYRALAGIREANERFDAAVLAWQGVVRVRPLEAAGWLSLARAQLAAGRRDDARRTLEHVLKTTWSPDGETATREAADLLSRIR